MKSLPVMLTAGVAFIGLVTTSNAKAANLGGSLFSTGGDVWVQVLKGDARDTSSLNLYSPQFQYIANNREIGRTINLGSFAVGQELVFGINNQKTGNTFFIGPIFRNADSAPHAIVNFLAPGVAIVGFDDGWEAGDWDFNDINFLFQGGIADAPPEVQPPVPPNPVPPNPITPAKEVPEPTSVLSILAFGAFGAALQHKRKRQQKALDSLAVLNDS